MACENQTKAVTTVINAYIEGTYTADRALLESVFHKKAAMSGYLGDELLLASPEAFIEDVTSKPSMKSQGTKYKGEITEISVNGKIATAVIRESGFFGEICFEDSFQLINDGGWKIISKLFTTVSPES